MNKLLNTLSEISPLSKETASHLASILQPRSVNKKDFLSIPGHKSPLLYLIEKGSIREFFIDEKGSDISTWFGFENDIAVSLASFLSNSPSYTGLQALEDCSLYSLTQSQLFEMYDRFPDMERLGRLITEYYFVTTEQHHYGFRHLKAKERYESMIQNQPQILQRVPLSHIASYLGISIETLSRIRAKNT